MPPLATASPATGCRTLCAAGALEVRSGRASWHGSPSLVPAEEVGAVFDAFAAKYGRHRTIIAAWRETPPVFVRADLVWRRCYPSRSRRQAWTDPARLKGRLTALAEVMSPPAECGTSCSLPPLLALATSDRRFNDLMDSDMANPLVSAAFGLLGVLVGAVAAVIGPMILERHRTERDLRKAKRLIAAELSTVQRVYESIDNHYRRGQLDYVAPLLEPLIWREYRPLAADRLDEDLWRSLTSIYAFVDVDRVTSAVSAAESPDALITENEIIGYQMTVSRIQDATDTLDPRWMDRENAKRARRLRWRFWNRRPDP